MFDLEHPDISRSMRDGMPEAETKYCPLCGAECEKFYIHDREIIGCDYCVEECEVDEWDGDY
jgi:ferredoxin